MANRLKCSEQNTCKILIIPYVICIFCKRVQIDERTKKKTPNKKHECQNHLRYFSRLTSHLGGLRSDKIKKNQSEIRRDKKKKNHYMTYYDF